METLEKGDVVKLRSGGPAMTVQNIGDYSMSSGVKNGAYCVWFEGKKQTGHVFAVETLVKTEPDPG